MPFLSAVSTLNSLRVILLVLRHTLLFSGGRSQCTSRRGDSGTAAKGIRGWRRRAWSAGRGTRRPPPRFLLCMQAGWRLAALRHSGKILLFWNRWTEVSSAVVAAFIIQSGSMRSLSTALRQIVSHGVSGHVQSAPGRMVVSSPSLPHLRRAKSHPLRGMFKGIRQEFGKLSTAFPTVTIFHFCVMLKFILAELPGSLVLPRPCAARSYHTGRV